MERRGSVPRPGDIMEIAEISTYDPRGFGGLETVVRELSKRFSAEHDITLFYRGTEHDETEFGRLRPVNDWLPHLPGHVIYNTKLASALSDEDTDLVHGHGQNGMGMAIRRALFSDDTPFVMTYHGTYAGLEQVRNRYRRIPIWNPLTKFEQWGGRAADQCIACSRQVKQELIDHYGISEENITVIHNGVDTAHYRPIPQDEAKDVLDLDADTTYLSWIGATSDRKGFDRAEALMAELDDYTLLVAGTDGKDTDRITFLGHVPEEHLPHFYNASDAFLFPTRYEGHPLVVLEALATHTPVITTEAANVEVAEKNQHYCLLEETDMNDIPAFIEQDCDFAFLEEYDWNRVAERYMDVFNQVC